MDTHTLSEMAGDWSRLATMMRGQNIILVGGAGCGKSCALKAILGTPALWLRCSQDPTLRDNRDRIKTVARRRVEEGKVAWIVLEHADLLHADAQAFLRRVMETSLGSCRFVLEVRDVAAIAEPLLSRTVLYMAPTLLEHEIRTLLLTRAPALSPDVATQLAQQCGGNVRWAVLQALGSGDGFLASDLPKRETVKTWGDVLTAMEALQASGSSPRAWLQSTDPVWERPGGADPWALVAHMLATNIVA